MPDGRPELLDWDEPGLGRDVPYRGTAVAPADPGLRGMFDLALSDSRERWRSVALLAADLAFEVDGDGAFTFVAPERVFGWPADALLGRRALDFAVGHEPSGPDPFRPAVPVRDRNIWFRAADGTTRRLRLSAMTVPSEGGGELAARGLAIDVTETEHDAQRSARLLRLGSTMRHVFDQLRADVEAPHLIRTVLDTIRKSAGAEGAAMIELGKDAAEPARLILAVDENGHTPPAVLTAVAASAGGAAPIVLAGASRLIVLPCDARLPSTLRLAFWRAEGDRPWSAEDRRLVTECTAILCTVIEQDAVQSEMREQARTDPLTGLLNRRAFVAEVGRHIDRLDRERLPGTLVLIDVDHFKAVNDGFGHAAGDRALTALANLLRATIRPSDVVARLGGDEFAVWLSGADHLAAAERAETLRRRVPDVLAAIGHPDQPWLTVSQGIACRWPGFEETLDDIFHRADNALYIVKRNGRAHWHVGHPPGAAGSEQPVVP